MTNTATCQRHLDGWNADAYLFALSEPLYGHSQVIVSALVPDDEVTRSYDVMIGMFEAMSGHQIAPQGQIGDPEVLIFKAKTFDDERGEFTADGTVDDADGLACGIRGTLDHEKALAKYGYETDWNGVKK
jgi:hypothetical protein